MGLWDILVAGTRRLYCLFRCCTWTLVLSLPDTLIRAPSLPTGPPAEASFEAELLARTRHCRVTHHRTHWITTASLISGIHATLQHAHFMPSRIARFDAQGTGDTEQSYTLEPLTRQNGAAISYTIRIFARLVYLSVVRHTRIDILKIYLEGWEFAICDFLMPSSEFSPEKPRVPPVSQMLLELHLWDREFPDLLKWRSTLERAGFRAVAGEQTWSIRTKTACKVQSWPRCVLSQTTVLECVYKPTR